MVAGTRAVVSLSEREVEQRLKARDPADRRRHRAMTLFRVERSGRKISKRKRLELVPLRDLAVARDSVAGGHASMFAGVSRRAAKRHESKCSPPWLLGDADGR